MGTLTARFRESTLARHLFLLGLGIIVVVLVTNQVADFDNYQLAQLGAYVCAAAGLTMLTGGNGQVSLGHAALMAIGGYTVALMQMRFTSHGVTGVWVLPVSLLIGTVVTAFAGAIFGVAAARLRGPYLAGATLALGVALPGITSHYSSFFKGDQGLFVPFDGPPSGLGANFTLQHWQAWISLFAGVITLFFLANLNRSAIGRHMRAVRDDEIASALCGLSVPRVQVGAF
ncbi:MAG: branched-chain amino acid ABC transporter permease, partial [Jatrophihabitantaceae bacterium]